MIVDTVLERVKTLALPVLAEMRLELVDLEYKRDGRDMTLCFYIDKEGGVTLDDCADFSHEIGMLLEVEEVIAGHYRLEVSSPGLDRPLYRPADYVRFAGRLVKVKTFDKLDPDGRGNERKTFVGRLLGLEDGIVRIEQNDKKGGVVAIPLAGIAKAHLELEF